ncbi:MAG: single-stranded DNA-binding protein [Roseinatronobacter sp.]
MQTFAEFQIIGRIGKITQAGSTLKISVAADYGKRAEDGSWDSKPFWNTVTVFNDKTVSWIKANVDVGDLVHTRGTIRETSYDKDGTTQYGVTLAGDQFSLLAKKDQ